jgi:hypothetical protein
MTKRILFAEITQGIEALSSARKGEITLRAEKVKLNPATKLSAKKQLQKNGARIKFLYLIKTSSCVFHPNTKDLF